MAHPLAVPSPFAVDFALNKIKSDEEILKLVHRLFYRTPGKATVIKKNIRAFSGFPEDADRGKAKDVLDRAFAATLNAILDLFDLPRGVGGPPGLLGFLGFPGFPKTFVQTSKGILNLNEYHAPPPHPPQAPARRLLSTARKAHQRRWQCTLASTPHATWTMETRRHRKASSAARLRAHAGGIASWACDRRVRQAGLAPPPC